METRPQEAARLRSEGCDLEAIAERMDLLESTVKLYLRQMDGRQKRPMPTMQNGLTARANSVIVNLGKVPIPEDVATLTEMEMLKLPNCGRVTVRQVKSWLTDHGLRFREELEEPKRRACPYCGKPI